MVFTVIVVAIALGLVLALIVAVLSLRKRFANNDLRLIGESGRVETTLTPEGTVIVNGELWPACSADDLVISSRRLVRIVGVDDLFLRVEGRD
ncbi:MAG: NfeD family protein [bacterium]